MQGLLLLVFGGSRSQFRYYQYRASYDTDFENSALASPGILSKRRGACSAGPGHPCLVRPLSRRIHRPKLPVGSYHSPLLGY